MKFLALILTASSFLLMFDAPPARACASSGDVDGCGGLTLSWDQPYYMPGELVTGTAEGVWNPKEAGRRYGKPDDGPYQAYLRPLGRNMRKPADKDPQAIPLGTLEIAPNETSVTISFVVPDVPGGEYTVSHCNVGCKKALGLLFDSSIRIIAGEAEERRYLAGRFQELMNLSYREGARAFRGLRKLSKKVDAKEEELLRGNYELYTQVRDLEGQVEKLRDDLDRAPAPDQRVPLAAAGGASVLAALALGRRRRGDGNALDSPS